MFECKNHGVGLRQNVKWLRGMLVFKIHRLLHHPTLGLRVIMKKRRLDRPEGSFPLPEAGRWSNEWIGRNSAASTDDDTWEVVRTDEIE